MRNFINLLLISFSVIIFSGCGTGQQKNNENGSDAQETEEIQAYRQEQNDLLIKANTELSDINNKILELNEKITENGSPLTDEQNNSIDSFEKKRESINQRIKEIKNVPMDDWEEFESRLETDLDEANEDIDKILADL